MLSSPVDEEWEHVDHAQLDHELRVVDLLVAEGLDVEGEAVGEGRLAVRGGEQCVDEDEPVERPREYGVG